MIDSIMLDVGVRLDVGVVSHLLGLVLGLDLVLGLVLGLVHDVGPLLSLT